MTSPYAVSGYIVACYYPRLQKRVEYPTFSEEGLRNLIVTVQDFLIGYRPHTWNNLLDAHVETFDITTID